MKEFLINELRFEVKTDAMVWHNLCAMLRGERLDRYSWRGERLKLNKE